jgi:hypothetical protein
MKLNVIMVKFDIYFIFSRLHVKALVLYFAQYAFLVGRFWQSRIISLRP